ncbi:Beta-parvin [Taenia solium]|eukprot:TsM_000378300 transcript=TsM_000378300 gene=TsM_000378300
MHQTSPHMHSGSESRGGGEGGVGSEGSGGGHAMSLVEKLNTMSRVRRRRQEAEALASEARQAMEDPLMPITPEIGPVGYQLAEGDECSMLEPHSKEQALVKELIQTLIEWINKELIDERILVRDIEADLYDGQVLQKLLEKLTGSSLNQPELTQTEMGQRVPDSYAAKNWPITAIFSKDLVAILRLLVALARRFAPDVRLPSNCQLTRVIVRKLNGVLQHRRQVEVVTEATDTTDASMERDAISALVDCAVPEKLMAFQRVLLQFVNQHLGKLNIVVSDLQKQMDDGVYFLLLMGLLGGYFIPLHKFHLAPRTNEQKLANLNLVLQLLQEAEGIEAGASTRADDLLRRDLKATLRFLYALYSRYKDME